MPWIKDGVEYSESQVRARHPRTSFPSDTAHWHLEDEEFGYVWQEPTIPPQPTLDELKTAKWRDVQGKRDHLEQAGFTFIGHPIDSDPIAVQRISIAALAAQAAAGAGQPFQVGWKCKDDHTLPLDIAGVMGMSAALAMYANALHVYARGLKDQIVAATDQAALDAIDIENGWPV